MDAGATQEVLVVCQAEKVSILLGKSLVPWLCGVFERHSHGRRKNRGC